ncbi:concanavalin A-like lectin/glucanase domain-containing protein, partial [Endogone sp. FLAS-F59071]
MAEHASSMLPNFNTLLPTVILSIPWSCFLDPGTLPASSYHYRRHLFPGTKTENATHVAVRLEFRGPLQPISVEHRWHGGLWKHSYTQALVRSNYPIPLQYGLFYWEVNLKFKCPRSCISVGICPRISQLEGFYYDDDHWCYNTHTGTVDRKSRENRKFGPKLYMGDTIGCGINFKAKSIFFTMNGKLLGEFFKFAHICTAFKTISLRYPLYPFVTLNNPGDQVEANFGAHAFMFDVLKYKK